MNKEQYMEYHLQFCMDMHETTKKKNSDYTGKSDDPFQNLKLCEHLGVASTEAGILTRMGDKIQRIASFIQLGFLLVKDESVEDTLADLANYCILLAAYIKSKRTPQ